MNIIMLPLLFIPGLENNFVPPVCGVNLELKAPHHLMFVICKHSAQLSPKALGVYDLRLELFEPLGNILASQLPLKNYGRNFTEQSNSRASTMASILRKGVENDGCPR